jgi:hypothetical protein
MTFAKAKKLVAIVIPLTKRQELTASEKISLHHLLHHLGAFDKYFIAPRGLGVDHPEVQNKYFSHDYFGSAEAHSKLLLSTLFYKSFAEYNYILIYHLDSLVFSNKLTEWCQKGYDYIAPPWVIHEEAPYAGIPHFEGKVGNGGFSLRRVESFIKVIDSNKYFIDPDKYWQQFCKNRSKFKQLVNLPRKYIKRIPLFNNAKKEIEKKITIEDMFWANRGEYYYPKFKIAPVDVALQFAFECVPQYCYQQNNYQLPFGCHAWEKYEKSFWEPFLLPGVFS